MARDSRAIVVIGMHRSGTSAIARGLQALGVFLGDDFLDAQPENPTGYWEDRRLVELNERTLKALKLQWDDVATIERRQFAGFRMWRFRRAAIRDLYRRFTMHRLWGFKDPRTIRLLPFWERTLQAAGVNQSYLLVIRNPASVAASLYARQKMDTDTARRLWLAYMVPYLGDLVARPLAIVDYDLLMQDPRGQLERIARHLELPIADRDEVDSFAEGFLNEKLRHTFFAPDDLDDDNSTARLTRDAFRLLYDVAADRRTIDAEFWAQWENLSRTWQSIR